MSTRVQVVKQSETPLRRTHTIIRDGWLTLHRVTGPQAPKWVPPVVDVVPPDTPHLHWVMPGNIDGQSRVFSLPTASSLSHSSLIGVDRRAVAALVDAFLAGLSHIRALPADGDRSGPTVLQRLHRWWTEDTMRGPETELRDRITGLLAPADRERVQHLLTTRHRTSVLGSASSSELFPAADGRSVHALVDEVCVGPADWEIGVLLGEQIEILAQTAPAAHPTEDPVITALLAHATTPWSQLGLIAGLRWLLHLHDYLTYVSYSDDIVDQAASACALITHEDQIVTDTRILRP